MSTRKFGYIRVSSKDQNEDRQIEVMKKLITDERDIFVDKPSGRDFNREQYQLLKRMLRKDDILYIHSLDCFGRNKEAILQEWKDITQNIQAHIVVLDMPLLDTTQYKDSLGTLITDLVLQILSWLAEEERTKIKTRQSEGIDAAKKKGKHLGRPKTKITPEFIEAYNKWKFGQITALDAMRRCNMTSPTFYRVVKRYKERGNKNQ
ncbi:MULTISPECIES: recombinase family protein [Bacillus cereus group]|uniref:recombinase family protein n=1 Tax=Bacillus cereus group TaxID=86661 RepID=UPI00123A47CD|nr:recombinase family protein [Bacillus cereus]KAA6458923.1 recombinase family protein [Bacillus cereus]KAA6470404.1 recombinase family protein [Bacillus cereus]KAB2412507.1 recombinase family protein [Bacillus cereus]KAB2435149.1 recombinase family protein [Bacillus cereus]KAB2461740.1 recombinase family protein [Bacillus cereus]